MKNVLLFETADMPEEVWKLVGLADIFGCDWDKDTGEYVVGYLDQFVGDGYARTMKPLDDWLIAGGAQYQQQVLIHHGTFTEYPRHLFKKKNI